MSALKETINNIIVKEECSKYKKKINLDEIFDLDKIPEEELKKQYYDVSLIHSDNDKNNLKKYGLKFGE